MDEKNGRNAAYFQALCPSLWFGVSAGTKGHKETRRPGSVQGPLERQACRLGCGARGGRLSAPRSSLFPEPVAPVGAALVTGEAGPALPPGDPDSNPGLAQREKSVAATLRPLSM